MGDIPCSRLVVIVEVCVVVIKISSVGQRQDGLHFQKNSYDCHSEPEAKNLKKTETLRFRVTIRQRELFCQMQPAKTMSVWSNLDFYSFSVVISIF